MKQNILLLSCALIVVAAIPLTGAAGDRWAWSNNKRNERAAAAVAATAGRNERAAALDSRRPTERLEDFDEDDRVTKKPQADADFPIFGNGINFNRNAAGFPGGFPGAGPYGNVGPVQFPQNGFNGNGLGPNVAVGVNQFAGGQAGLGPGFFGGPNRPGAGYFPGNGNGVGIGVGVGNGNNNVLVGPGGPTGIVGRPAGLSGQTPGVLVGPGGPTGIVGRPGGFGGAGYGANYGGANFGGAGFGGGNYGAGYGFANGLQNGYGAYGGRGPEITNIGIDFNNNNGGGGFVRPGGFGGAGFGGPGQFGILPYNSGSNIQAFDEPEESGDGKSKKAEGKSN